MTQWHETELRGVEDDLQNARALIEKLQGLNASLQHQVTALHTEIARADEHANELRAQLAQQADPAPDIDTAPLADLLEAIGTYLEPDQAVTIRGSYEPVRQVEIHAMGLTFAVDTREASEALTKLQELGGCLVQEA